MLLEVFFLGLFGGLHCVGMCGPLALGLRVPERKSELIVSRLFYNSGRILSYGLLGGLISLLGISAFLFEIQQYLAITLGFFILWSGFSKLGWIDSNFGTMKLTRSLVVRITLWLNQLQDKVGIQNFLFLGILNGFLPCGLVYMGLAYAALAPDVFSGASIMVAFGLGTLPVMLLLSFGNQVVSPSFRHKIIKFLPWVVILVGLLLIIRGLGLDIPYLSPLWPENGIPECD